MAVVVLVEVDVVAVTVVSAPLDEESEPPQEASAKVQQLKINNVRFIVVYFMCLKSG